MINKMDEERAALVGSLRMLESLNTSVAEAGGNVVYSLSKLQNMTVFDLIAFLGPNGIRFCYMSDCPIERKEE